MNLDELQSVQARERQSSDLQHLRSSFYREVGEYIHELTEERARKVEQAEDPFSSSEVRRLSDDIETAEGTVEAIYERRVGKVVKKASIAAAGMPVDDDGLTDEEEALFDDLVARIEDNRESVLSVLDGDAPSVSCSIDDDASETAPTDPARGGSAADSGSLDTGEEPSPSPSTASDTDGVSAAELMGSGPSDAPEEAAETAPSTDAENEPAADPESLSEDPLVSDSSQTTEVHPDPEPPATSSESRPSESEGDRRPKDAAGADDSQSSSNDSGRTDIPGIPRTTVRITADVGEMVGTDNRDYDLGSEDVVTLPEGTAEALVDNGAAEPLE
jgi:DNA replication factor GINS